jgi:hypothetical protein
MKEFLILNKSKLKFAFGFISLIFTTFVLIIFTIGYFNEQVPDLSLFITVILGAGIGMPLFILIIGTIRGTWDLHKRRKAFDKLPFSELLNHGFFEHLKNENNRWQFSEPVLTGNIDKFQILAEVDTQNAPDVMRFQALTEMEIIDKDEVKRLSRKLSQEDIELDFKGVTKKISIKNHRLNSANELISELSRFTSTIERENFKPAIKEQNMV